jgi:hypothetical protein
MLTPFVVLAIAFGVGMGLLMFAGAAIYIFRDSRRTRYGDAATRARRDAAVLRGEVTEGAPFALSGVGRGANLSLNLDLDFGADRTDLWSVIGRSGIRLEYELRVGDRVIETIALQLPKDRMPRNAAGRPEMEETEMGGSSHIECTCLLTNFAAPAGVPVTVSGRAQAMPDNRILSAVIWVG